MNTRAYRYRVLQIPAQLSAGSRELLINPTAYPQFMYSKFDIKMEIYQVGTCSTYSSHRDTLALRLR